MSRQPRRLSKQERQEQIVAELHIRPAIRASEIAEKLGVHAETVRRDLKDLDRGGLINRTYGGAAVAPLAFEPSLAGIGLGIDGPQRVAKRDRGLAELG